MLSANQVTRAAVIAASFFFTITLSGNAQAINGVVKDAETERPLAGANIVQVDTDNGTSTDEQGRFDLRLLEDQSPRIKISYVGYKDKIILVEKGEEELLISLEPGKSVSLDEIIVLSTRAGEDDPITQTTVNREEIQKTYTGQDPSIVLQEQTPSIISYSDAGADIGNYVQFRLRGIDQTRINTTLNGVPLNDMVDQGVFFSNFSDFGNSVQSVQVQRGVGTSANGTASYAGSVNFESVRLNRDDTDFGFQLTGGSFNTGRVSGEVNTGELGNDLGVYSRFTRTISDGYKDHSGSDSYSFFFSGGYLGSDHILKVTGFSGKTQNDQSYLPVLMSDIEDDPTTNYNGENDTDDFEQELIQLQYARSVSEYLTMNSTLYYGGARGVFPFSLSATNQLFFGLRNNHYGVLSDIDYQKSRLKLNAGIHGYLFRRENFNGTAPNTANPDYEDETDKNEISAFTKANLEAGDFNLFADLQVRFVELVFRSDQVVSFGGEVPPGVNSARDWVFINPKVGVTYNVNERSSFYASFGRTGREPTRTDILQGDGSAITEANIQSVLNEDIVVEEYVNDLELGYRYRGPRISLTANYFYMDFENEISHVGALAENSYIPLRQNVPDSYRTGVEFAGEFSVGKLWQAHLNATYLSTSVSKFVNASSEVFRDVERIFAPRWNINPGLRFTPTDAIGISLNGRYVSESFMELSNDSDFVLPDYFVLDGQVDVNITESIKFSLHVNNIFDKLYFNQGAPVDIDFDGTVDGPGYRVQPPFNLYGQLRLRF